ncbi:MAG: COP23 domain-containing protein [Cyanobacteriota bacterium]
MSLAKAGLVVGIIGAVIAGASFINDVANGRKPPLLFSKKNDRFTCESRPYPNEGEIWTVVYHNDKEAQPWLRMVNTFGGDWNTPKRCGEIERRLENYRQDGLTAFDYRTDLNTPGQSVICAKTKLSGDNCNLLVTLDVGVDPYTSLSKMIEALENKTTVDQNSKGEPSAPLLSPASPSVHLGNFLANEDLNAGDTAKK